MNNSEVLRFADAAADAILGETLRPPIAGVAFGLMNSDTGNVGASVDRDGNLVDSEGNPFLGTSAQSLTIARLAQARENLGLDRITAAAPTEIDDLEFWFAADSIETLDGVSVSTLPDSSGNDRDATKRSGTALFYNTALGGKPGVLLSSVDFITPAFLDSSFDTALTVIVLYNITGTPGVQFGVTGSGGTGSGVSSGIFGGSRGGKDHQFFAGAAGSIATAQGQNALAPHCDVYRYDGSEITLRQNRQTLLPFTSTAAIGFNDGRFCIGSAGSNTGVGWDHLGYVYEAAVFSRALTDDEVRSIERYFSEKYNILNKPRLVFVGDSIFRGNASGATTVPPGIALEAMSGSGYDYDVAVLAHEGDTLQIAGPSYATAVDADIVSGDDLTLVCELGINDCNGGRSAANMWSDHQSWGTARKLAGVDRLLFHTISPGDPTTVNVTSPTFETRRASFNTTLRSDYASAGADGIVDIAANSSIGDEADAYNGTPGVHPSTYYLDGIHPNDAGIVIWAEVIKSSLDTLFASEATNMPLAVYGAGSAYSLTNTAAAIDFGTTDPTKVIDRAGTYLVLAQVHLTYTGATVAAQTATIKVRRTNNTAADVSVAEVIDLPVSTTLTHTLGIFSIPPFIYSTSNDDDSLSVFANVSAALSAGTIDATAIGTSLVAIRLY